MAAIATQENAMSLIFLAAEAFYELDRPALCWYADNGREAVLCKATIDAIGSLYNAAELAAADYRIIFARHRKIFEAAASRKFETSRRWERGPILVDSADISPHRGKFGQYHRGWEYPEGQPEAELRFMTR
jgi:hypothetical protein